MSSKPVLVTMPHSHYCEKARWALDLMGVDYVEEAHPPMFHWTGTVPRGGRSVPVLVQGGKHYRDSTDILLHLDASGAGLFPQEPDLRRQTLELEEAFDLTLGPHARRWAYAQLLPHASLLRKAMAPPGIGVEQSLLPLVLPIVKRLIRRSLRISKESALRSLGQVDQAFLKVEHRLEACGGAYLVGDRFTAADLTFASLAAPVLLPRQFRGQLPALEEVPGSMREEVLRLRQTIAGTYALRMFEVHRGRRVDGVQRDEVE